MKSALHGVTFLHFAGHLIGGFVAIERARSEALARYSTLAGRMFNFPDFPQVLL
ncbi:MAG: hypothetical protein GWQ05_03975 [Verrucomicrobiaceae bacterium]|nr:hypothetical protein [Verrucomicrobiaceae bacterium]NCF90105.1 hypothetical protein [Verrucomicrobiaceae bacterium]